MARYLGLIATWLWRQNRASNPNPPSADPRYFEQYKLAVEMADRLSARRGSANAFFATLNSVLIAVIGLVRMPDIAGPVSILNQLAPVVVAAGGIFLCFIWFMMLRSYRHLSSAKWAVINSMEQHLPHQPFDAEWAQLPHDERKWRDRYRPLTWSEQLVPWLFAAAYVVAATVFLWPVIEAWL